MQKLLGLRPSVGSQASLLVLLSSLDPSPETRPSFLAIPLSPPPPMDSLSTIPLPTAIFTCWLASSQRSRSID